MGKIFPFYQFSGMHYQIGWQYGATCKELIRKNLDLSIQRLLKCSEATQEQVLSAALAYQPYLVKYAPFLDEEIQGMSGSTGLSTEEIYFLQLRAEIQAAFSNVHSMERGMECTSFAISCRGTADRSPLAGQNADLPAFYADICVVVEIVCVDHPAVLMLTPAGQVSYMGMNQYGLCAFANYLVCEGWRLGFPRYCLSRLALTAQTSAEAGELLIPVERASSRNILLIDSQGEILDLEFSVKRYGRLIPSNGRLVHANHFVSAEMLDEERSTTADLNNSQVRLRRLQQLIDDGYGSLDVTKMQTYLRDRETYPHPLCIEAGDPEQGDEMTVASVIAEPGRGCLWAAAGPPNRHPYKKYLFMS